MPFEYKFIQALDEDLKKQLQDNYNIDELDIEDIYTNTQLSKIEQRSNYLYVFLQFPEYNSTRRKFSIKEVHCLISDKYLLILDKHNFKHVQQFESVREGILDSEDGPFATFYEMLDFVLTRIFRAINKFRLEVGELEASLFDADVDTDHTNLIMEIQIVKRNLINFISIISPLKSTITELQTKYTKFIDNKGVELLDDSLDKIKKMINNLNNYRQQMDMVTETNEVLIAHNSNETIKRLTSVNLIAIIPMAVTSFFGMNVYFGWNSDSIAPLIVIIITVLMMTYLTLYYFKKKNWL